MIKQLRIWWAFSRPHTIIGSFCSITALYCIVTAVNPISGASAGSRLWEHFPVYFITLMSALACNVFIVGLNQWQDVEVDRINKPWLPMASGAISMPAAQWAVWGSLVLSLVLALLLGWSFLILMAIICAIGAAYSLPPLKLKRHHLPAAMAIIVVRGLLVNLGMAAHFQQQMGAGWQIPEGIWPLAVFVAGFSAGIAWFKDIPDTEGDEQFRFQTLAVTYSRKKALGLGVAVVTLSYLLVMLAPKWISMPVNITLYTISHLLLCLLFLIMAGRLNLNDARAVKRFYLFFWGLFFAEYIIYPISFWLNRP